MKVIANNIRIGNILEFENGLWLVTKREHTKPGKGGAFIQAELKNIQTGTKTVHRFRSSEDVSIARVEEKSFKYLYDSGDAITLMDDETFEQIEVSKELLGTQVAYLKDNLAIAVEYYDEAIIGLKIPEQVQAKIVETETTVKGQTANASYKPAVLDNGIRITVPPFIEVGDMVVVNTINDEYVERVKKS
jgi:elongation factor P